MQSTPRLHSRTDKTEVRDLRPTLAELRRKAWDTLLDLGLTDQEIAAYFGCEPDKADPAASASKAAC